ncbi:MAG: ABC transporter substrate-binding protein, partial [Candidatus Berkelbacteria bacterium]|nr:ABC transporter substrate-binding protein [Candidatus Berkelbacteria bacterium]
DKVSTKGRSAFGGKNQNLKFKIKDSGTILLVKIKPIFSIVGNFFRRLGRIYNVLNRVDKIALGILLIILLGLAGYKFDRDWLSKTKRVPTTGGTYKEVLIGQAQYLNPVLANSDADRTMNQLIYSGLTKIDSAGNIAPDLAKSWEISADSKTYTFHLRSDVSWQDGVAFSSADVAATISAIKDDNIKSPYFDAWKDVVTSTPNPNTVTFTLKSPYGPFLYNTSIGIIPAHIDSSAISSSPVGTGPYQFTKAISGNNKLISEVDLARYNSYYGQKPYISEVDFQIAENETKAKDNLNNFFSPAQAVAGLSIKDDATSYSFATSRDFGMIFNLNADKFKDVTVRKKIAGSDKFDPSTSFKLLVLDKPLSVSTAEDLQKSYASRGINIILDKKGAVEYTNLLEKRNYEAVLYGFDSGYDRDPYPFWHSSQITTGNNFSGFSNKQADLLLESARMTTDTAARNQKYDQFFAILADQAPVIYLPPQDFSFSVKPSVMGITAIKGFEPWDHLNDFANWYLKTKRVRP